MEYLLWSGRLSGWLSSAGTYVSGTKDARIFARSEALQYCRAHYRSSTVEFGLIPVRYEDVKEISA